MSKTISVLTSHGNRGWYKWINGASRYICSSKLSADEANSFWYRNKDAICSRFAKTAKAARTVRPDSASLGDLVSRYLESRLAEQRAGAISASHYAEIRRVCRILVKNIVPETLVESLRADHFAAVADALARFEPRTRRKRANIVKTLFTQAAEDEWIDVIPNTGRRLKKLSTAPIEDLEKDVYSAEECRAILGAIDARVAKYAKGRPDLADSYKQLKLLVLLAINGGLGMAELAALKVSSVRLHTAMLETVREKTKVKHRVPLWPETLELLAPHLKGRKQTETLFKTRKGFPLVRSRLKGHKAVAIDGPSQTFRDLVTAIGLKRPGHGFYLLRSVHRTVSGGAGDESAADVVFGHRLGGQRGAYQQVSLERLRRVSEHVRRWLFNLPLPEDPRHDREPSPAPVA